MKKLLSFLTIAISANAIAQSGKMLNWSDIPLTWNDFTPIEKKQNKTANIFTNMNYKIESLSNSKEVLIQFKSTLTQVKEKSAIWSTFLKDSPKEEQNALLKHEKGHLVIAFIKQFWLQDTLEKVAFNAKTYETQMKAIYADVLKRGDALDNDYDKLTYHSTIEDQQIIWEQKLMAQLNELSKGKKNLPWVVQKEISIKK